MDKKQIVILGGGYAGVHAAKALHKAFKKQKDKVEITLIDKNRHHILMTELHEVAGNRVDEASVKISFDRIFSGKMVRVVQDKITSIDFEKQVLAGERSSYSYDQLLISTGAQTADFNIPGVKEHAFYLWSLEDALKLRTHIECTVRKAVKEADEEKRKQMLTFVVAGGGFTGVELIGELTEWLPILCKKHGIDFKREVRLINCEGLGNILNMLPEKPREKAVKRMEKKGVEIMLNSLITNVEADRFTTKNGDVIKTETLVWTCGVRGTEFCERLPLTDGKIGRKAVNEFMQSPDHNNVYLAGDGMWFIEDNRAVPQIVEAAEQTAKTAADGIVYTIKQELGLKATPPKPYKSNFHGYMVSIGGTYAVSHTAGISLSGFFAMALKHLVNLYYQSGVCGVNAIWGYIKHEILEVKGRRSLIGGMATYKIPSYWTVFLRMYLGVMWLIEGIGKINKGWLTDTTGSKVYWGAPAGAESADSWASASQEAVETVASASQAAVETVASASQAAVETVASASQAAGDAAAGAVEQFAPPLLSEPLAIFTWINDTFVAQAPYFFQIMIVLAELGIGLLFLAGLFTFPAAIVSLGLSVMFLIGALAGKEILWYMAVSIVMLGGAGKAFGLDYWVMPYIKKLWNKTPLAKKTYFYLDEPEFTKKQMERKLGRK
ncbi:FAD-dependent oxidoreductase [uncultured Sphaerochaeta sp.]|uniref:FAD-dependent oxidoreductase n=1 Tax=uncultured Sphaerochaeta sp. TaxID=886478 RepID=UPI0029CA052C|nr:FAD-dependent oxidoreductase [uncultured Sphaerochaeta sp.]